MSYKYRFADGSPCKHPTSYEQACEVKSRLYDTGETCPTCESRYKIRYTKTRGCVKCSRLKSINLIHMYKGFDQYIWTDDDGRHWGEPDKGQVKEITQEEWDEMVRLVELANSSVDFNITDEQCSTHGHYSLKRLGKCHICSEERKKPTPRQAALQSGETWYTPDTPCNKCCGRALRNVHNGSCQGCVKPRQLERSATTIMMEENPDMVISRDDAQSLDMLVYRTGDECKRGHKSWRYVSTSNCVECLKQRREGNDL